MASKPKVVGEGSYGCVLKPSLKCDDKNINYKDKVSKVMYNNDALQELEEYENIAKFKELYKYAIVGPEYCQPLIDKNFVDSVSKCKNPTVQRLIKANVYTLSLLILQDGGISVYDYLKLVFPKQTLNEQKIFLTSIINLIDGLIFFRKNEIMHRDIKLANIVYNVNNGMSKFIDFGLMTTNDRYISNCKNNRESLGISHSYWPPENSCTNKINYNDKHNPKCVEIKNNFPTHDKLLNHMVLSFDLYCFSLAMLDAAYFIQKMRVPDIFLRKYLLLFVQYCPKDPFTRNTNLEQLKTEYTKLLKDYNLYSNVKPNPSPVVEKIVDKIIKEEEKNEEKKCPPNKPILNPNTGRCVIECRSGQIRNKDFRCVNGIAKKNIKTKKVEKTNSDRKRDCESLGKVYNPTTKRCNKKTKKTTKQKTTPERIKNCESQGKVYNTKTKRCNKIK
tara:strand:+ start:5198 stop:6535 length:1338 start_codon:yes stop_codon:yes gene_type:complete